jgi:predicted Zn-dependent protease
MGRWLLGSELQRSANGKNNPNDQSAQGFSPRFHVYSTLNQTNAASKWSLKNFREWVKYTEESRMKKDSLPAKESFWSCCQTLRLPRSKLREWNQWRRWVMRTVRIAAKTTVLTGLALAFVCAASSWAQTTPSSTAPGTTPVGGDAAVNPDKIVEVGSQPVKVKPGSIDDVNAVGKREIGGRGIGNWYSTDYETRMGQGYAQQVEKAAKLITDPVVTEYVNRIGQNIVKNSDCKVPFTIKVIDTDEINAFALPGGFFYVNSGLILNADEESELAGVMAHETAHVCAHHMAKEMTRSGYAQIGMMPMMILVGGWASYGIYEGSQLAIPIAFLKFDREFETQADYLGIQYMYRAGYDPQAFITFFEKIQALQKRKPGLVSKAFADHPQTPDRILHSQEEIARILPARDEYTVTTSEFDDVKARLTRIENKRRLTDTKDGKKPSLRKPGTSTGDSSSDDDKPTLHR